jgi:hypothetical protein
VSAHADEIDFGDPRGVSDLRTFIGRARVAQPEGAVRLQAPGPRLLVLTVAVLEGAGLLGEGTVLGLRAVPVRAVSAGLDATVSFASVAERLPRLGPADTVLAVPHTTVAPAWAGLTPPREGWERVGGLPPEDVKAIAEQGISDVAQGTPEGAGGPAVAALRRRVWAAMSDTVPPIKAGLAFGAHVLGFIVDGEEQAVSTCGRWTRLSTSRGHLLVR